jgi:hypothetical protein
MNSVIFSEKKLARIVQLHPDLANGKFQAPAYVLRNRHNKTAAGMTKTIYRSCQSTSEVSCSLGVKGTTDRLGSAFWMYVRRDRATNKFRLTDKGRTKLARLRREVSNNA